MTADPKTLLAGPLRRAGIPDAEILAAEQVALLRGHQLLADDGARRSAKTKAGGAIRRDCREHPGTETPGGRCPSCGPTGV